MVTNVPRLTVPSFALAELKTGDFSEIRLVEQGRITSGSGASRVQGVRYRVGGLARHHGGKGDQVQSREFHSRRLILSRTSTESGGRGSQKPARKKNLVAVLLFQLRFGRAS